MALPQVPKPLLGTHLTNLVLSGMAVAGDGSLTVGASITLATSLPSPLNINKDVNTKGSPGKVEINAMNTRQRNNVITDDGFTLDLGIYQVNNGNTTNPLEYLCQLYDIFKCVWVTGTVAGSIATHTFYGIRGELDNTSQDRGVFMATLHLDEIDPGAPTVPQYAVVYS